MTIKINADKLDKIKERMEYYNTMMDHPELLATEQDQRDILEQWRGCHFILRNLGIEL